MSPKSSDTTPGSAAIAHASCTAPGVSISTLTGNRALEAELRGAIGDVREEALDVGGALRLGQREERDAVAGAVEQHVDLRLPRRVVHVVHAGADARKAVVGAADEARHQHGVRALAADGRAVLAVAGDVEHGPALGLQRERLADEALAARVVHARRQRRQAALSLPYSAVCWRRAGAGRPVSASAQQGAPRRRALPRAPSACAFIFSRENSSIGRSRTRVYSPLAVVTGTP